MLLRHATLIRNLLSIQRHGLLCSKSQGRLKAVWLATEGKSSWAAMHVVERHGGRIEAVVTLEVDVPRSWLRRSRKGLWYCTRATYRPNAFAGCSASWNWPAWRADIAAEQGRGNLFRYDSSQKRNEPCSRMQT